MNNNEYDYNREYSEPSPGPGPEWQQASSQSDWVNIVSWVVDIGLIFAVWPLGIILTVMRTKGRDVIGDLIRSFTGQGGTKTTARAAQPTYASPVNTRTASSRTTPGTSQQYRPTAQQRTPVTPSSDDPGQKQQKKNDGIRHADAGAAAREIFGWILGGFGLLAAMGAVVSAGTIWAVLTYLAMALGGGLLIFSGRQGKKKEAAFRRCVTVSGTKGVVRLRSLAKTLGMEEEDLEKQLGEMIDRGYYGVRAYIDHARSLLVIEPEQMRDIYRAEDEEKADSAARRAQEQEQARMAQRSEYEKLVDRLRQADEDIEDEAMSEKIRQMQAVTEAIFREVALHPEKRQQIDRFMNYYLPTTLKLLDSYARIEAQGVTGENTAKAKADIERIADTLVEGYRTQLDSLYGSEAVDIAGDVSVIESMMRRDGLTGQDDFRPFRQFVEQPGTAAPSAEEGTVLGGH